MSSLQEIFDGLCTSEAIPKTRYKDVLTALRYLAAAHDSTPEVLSLMPEMEQTYKAVLRDYLTAQKKGPSTIRNSIQGVGQFLRAYHQLPANTPIQQLTPRNRLFEAARKEMGEKSPYAHQGWMTHSKYTILRKHWPEHITAAYEPFEHQRRREVRQATLDNYVTGVCTLLGYLGMSAEERLQHLPPEAYAKLQLKRYAEDLRLIRSAPQTVAWDDLFVVEHIRSFVCWHVWRAHAPADAKVRERPPSTPTTLGIRVAETMLTIAHTLGRSKDHEVINAYRWSLHPPEKRHDKSAPYHQFSFAELERIGRQLMEEARCMNIDPNHWRGEDFTIHPGGLAASRFMVGLVMMLGWRIPMRARNWTECLIDTHLLHDNGVWRFRFKGDDLKVGMRPNGKPNLFEMEIPPECVPSLEEYLHVWRPRLPLAQEDRHLLLALRGEGGMLKVRDLCVKLKVHTYRLAGKRFFTHLLRTIFTSNMLSNGMDINSVAFGVGDLPSTVWQAYNELQGGKHQQSLQEAYRRALTNGHQPLTPPVIPFAPSTPPRPAASSAQLSLLE